jgi:hypothetical protein
MPHLRLVHGEPEHENMLDVRRPPKPLAMTARPHVVRPPAPIPHFRCGWCQADLGTGPVPKPHRCPGDVALYILFVSIVVWGLLMAALRIKGVW